MHRSLTTLLIAGVLGCAASAQEPRPAPKPPARAPSEVPGESPSDSSTTPRQRIREVLGLEVSVAMSKLRRAAIGTRTPYGFSVRSVAADSVAAAAGLKRGDVVLEIDGAPWRDVAALGVLLGKLKPGEKVVLQGARRKAGTTLLDRHPWEDFRIELTLPAAEDGQRRSAGR